MKKYNLLIALSLGIAFTSCDNQKNLEKNVLSINTSQLKQLYKGNESLKLNLELAQNTTIDSVSYYLNDKKIGAVTSNKVLEYNLSKEKYGKVQIKGIAYASGNNKEVISNIEIVSPMVPKFLKYKLLNTFPHDQEAYTQGLEFYNGILYESTGNGEGGFTTTTGRGTGKKGISSVRQINYKTGEILKIHKLPIEIFGEGCTILNDKLYQLTYLNNEGYIYNPETLEKEKTFKYFKNMQGWGLCNDGESLYMTDGSEKIYKVDPENFKELDYINVYTNNGPIGNVNELEWVNGKIYANVYGGNAIAIIDPETGAVEAAIDFSDLLHKTTYHEDRDVFNGIAYNPATKTFFVTGKNWDKMFEVEIVEE